MAEDITCPDESDPDERRRGREFDETGETPAGAGFGPRTIGRYRLIERLGAGGMGEVWRAQDTKLDRDVALKMFRCGSRPSRILVQRFLREAQAAGQLRHPGLVAVHEIGLADETLYYTSDIVEGEGLDLVIRRGVSEIQAARIVRDIARTLAYAHDRGIVHRDVKPANILIDADGRPRLVDFGLAKLLDTVGDSGSDLTRSGAVLGTPSYMSPEQALGRREAVGPAADQFSLGVLFYELLTGSRPFGGESVPEVLVAICLCRPIAPRRVRPEIDAQLETLCLRALELEPLDRFASLDLLAEDLDRFLDGKAVRSRPTSTTTRARRWIGRRSPVVATGGGLALLVSILAVVAIDGRRRSTPARAGLEDPEASREDPLLHRAAERQRALDLIPETALALQMLERTSSIEADARRRNATDVLARIDRVLDIDPDLAVGHHLRGRALEIEGWPDRAEASFRRAVELDPHFGPSHFALGRLLMVRAFLAGMATSEARRQAHQKRMEALVEESSAAFDHAFENGSGFDDRLQRRLARAMIAFSHQEYETAARIALDGLEDFESVEGVEDFHWILGLVQRKGSEGARRSFSQAIAARPNHSLALFCRAVGWPPSQAARAMADYDQAIGFAPRFALAYYNRGCLRMRLGNSQGALDDFGRSIGIDPEHIAGYSQRASLLLMIGEPRRALADLDRAHSLEPEDAGVLINRAVAHERLDDHEAALADYALAEGLDPASLVLYTNRSSLRRGLGDLAGAMADAGKAIALAPEDPGSHESLGLAHFTARQYVQAIRALDVAIAHDPNRARSYYHRGCVRQAAGDNRGAIGDFQIAIRLDPGDRQIAGRVPALIDRSLRELRQR